MMQEMVTKNTLLRAILIVTSLFFMILAFSAFRDLSKMKLDFSEKKAKLMKANLDLGARYNSLQEAANEKIGSLAALEKDKSILYAQIETLNREHKKTAGSYKIEEESLRKKVVALKKKIAELRDIPIVQQINESLSKEENENIKNVLKYALDKIELAKSGKDVTLEPNPTKEAVFANNEVAVQRTTVAPAYKQSQYSEGSIVLVDHKNKSIAIDLGSNDGVKEGYRYQIMRGEDLLGAAKIVSVRSRISAAFIEDMQGKFTVDDIKEDCHVKFIES